MGLAPFLVRVEPQCPCLEIAIVFHKVQLLRNDLLMYVLQQKGKKCLYQHKQTKLTILFPGSGRWNRSVGGYNHWQRHNGGRRVARWLGHGRLDGAE